MKIANARESYQYYTQTASTVTRQLGFAGIALIWVFKQGKEAQWGVPAGLVWPGFLIFFALALDSLHYILGSLIWGIYHRLKEQEQGISEDTEFTASPKINWPTLICFWGKIIVMLIAYGLLIHFLAQRL